MPTEHKTPIVVRYAETDQMGSVHHSSYVLYFEAARVEHLSALGLPYHEIEKGGAFLPVIELSVQYHKPARFGDTVEVLTRFQPLSGIRMIVDYEIVRGQEKLVSGRTVHAFVGPDGRPCRPPAAAAERLK